MEIIEKRGNGPRPWRVRYQDNPDDPWMTESGFATKAEARRWIDENPVVDVPDDRDAGE